MSVERNTDGRPVNGQLNSVNLVCAAHLLMGSPMIADWLDKSLEV